MSTNTWTGGSSIKSMRAALIIACEHCQQRCQPTRRFNPFLPVTSMLAGTLTRFFPVKHDEHTKRELEVASFRCLNANYVLQTTITVINLKLCNNVVCRWCQLPRAGSP
jgi:predicted metal-binding protein